MIQIAISEIRIIGRATAGVRLMKLDKKDEQFISSIGILENEEALTSTKNLIEEEE